MTRSSTRHDLLEDFSKCTVRIIKIPYFDQLLRSQRSAKIKARRRTVAVDGSISHSGGNGQSALFKKVTNKPFTNRRSSVSHAAAVTTPAPNVDRFVPNHQHQQSSSINASGIDVSSAGPPSTQNVSLNDIDVEQNDVDVSQLNQQSSSINASGIDVSSAGPPNTQNVSSIDIDIGRNDVPVSPLNESPFQSNLIAFFFDSTVPDNLPTPLVPIKLTSIPDVPVPDEVAASSLPQPIRTVPDLIPILNCSLRAEPKRFMGGRRLSTAQFILDRLDEYERPVTMDNGFDSSGGDFGELRYSDSE